MDTQMLFHRWRSSVYGAEETAKNARLKLDAVMRVVSALLNAGIDESLAYPTMDVAEGTIKEWSINGVRLNLDRGFTVLVLRATRGGEVHDPIDIYPGVVLPASAIALLVKP